MDQRSEGIPPSPQEVIPKSKDNFKGRVMKSLGAGILGIAMSRSPVGAVQPQPTEGYPSTPIPTEVLPGVEQVDPVEEIKRFVEAKGTEEITFDEATGLIPHLANFFAENTNSRYTPEEMVKRTFIIRDSLREYDQFPYVMSDEGVKNFDSPVFARLKADYPDLVPNELVKNATVTILADQLVDYYTIGFSIDDLVFIFLDRVNGHMPDGENKTIQFKSFEDIDCEKASPANTFNHVALHELGHLDHDYPEGAVMSQELESNEDILLDNKKSSNKLVQDSEVNGFQIDIDNKGYRNDYFATALDENGVEIAVAKMVLDNDLFFTTTGFYNSPRELSNFNAILEQAGISADDMLSFHRASDLKGFIFKVIDSIPGKNFSSDDEKFRFGLKLFEPFIEGSRGWEIPFKKDFPAINLKGYPDKPYYQEGRSFIGCGVPFIKKHKK